jgi:uncharacterized protein
MTGLTFKNCDTFYRRVYIYLGSISLGLSGFLTMGCTPISPTSSSILPLTASNASTNVISDPASNPNKLVVTEKNREPDGEKAQYLPITARAKIAGRIINLEVTRTISEQSKGLMFRSTLPDDRGMLFNFDPPQSISFWMKNVPVPLDMVFIYQGKIVAIAPSAAPCKATPCAVYPSTPVVTDRVIELRSGLAKEMGLKLGDRVTFETK